MALATAGSVAGAPAADYAIASIEYAPAPLQVVGAVRMGLLCLPKGKLRWRDVALPRESALADRLVTILRAQGLSVAARPDPLYGDPPPVTAYRLRVTVREVQLRLCVPGLGIGKKPATHGTVRIRWERFDRVLRKRTGDVAFDIPVETEDGDARTARRVISDAIEASAVRFAASPR